VVKLLLEREDVHPNLQDKDGDGPLGCAAINGHEGVVKLLLEREDVDPNLQGKDGDGPLGCAAIKGHQGVVKLLLGGKMSTPIAEIRMTEHHSDGLLLRDSKELSSYL